MDTVLPPDASAEAVLLSGVFAIAHRVALVLTDDDGDEASDLAQDVVLECLVRLRTRRWRVDTTLEARVASMVWCHHGSATRREENESARICQHVSERYGRTASWMDPARRLEDRETDAAYRRALSELPSTCRKAFVLVREEEATSRAAAAHLKITFSYVCKLVRRAEHHLAARLGIPHPQRQTPRSIRKPTHRRERTPRREPRTPRREPHTPRREPQTDRPRRKTSDREPHTLRPEQHTLRPEPHIATRRVETPRR